MYGRMAYSSIAYGSFYEIAAAAAATQESELLLTGVS